MGIYLHLNAKKIVLENNLEIILLFDVFTLARTDILPIIQPGIVFLNVHQDYLLKQ